MYTLRNMCEVLIKGLSRLQIHLILYAITFTI